MIKEVELSWEKVRMGLGVSWSEHPIKRGANEGGRELKGERGEG